jgi:hypothetical protein
VGNAVVDAIFAQTQDARVRMAMVMGGMLESGLNVNAVGDNGKSFGPFQIYTVAHPNVSPAQAKDPTFAVRFMLPQYQAGVAKVPDAIWQANPAKAAATAAFYAERPKNMYPDSRISSSWGTVQAALNGQDVTVGGSGGGAVTASNPLTDLGTSVDSAVESFRRGVMVLANMALFFAAIIVGTGFMAVGLVMLFRDVSASSAYGSVRSGAGKTVRAPFKVVGATARYWFGPKGERGYDYGGDQ